MGHQREGRRAFCLLHILGFRIGTQSEGHNHEGWDRGSNNKIDMNAPKRVPLQYNNCLFNGEGAGQGLSERYISYNNKKNT